MWYRGVKGSKMKEDQLTLQLRRYIELARELKVRELMIDDKRTGVVIQFSLTFPAPGMEQGG